MKVYRLARRKYATDISGIGAKLNGGRWNSRGKKALYTAESISLALLEVAVHLGLDLLPTDYCIIEIEFPDTAPIKVLDKSTLIADWDAIPHAHYSQRIGDVFLEENAFLVLKTPSAIVTQEFNYIINPNHSRFNEVQLISIEAFSFDHRLLIK